MWNKKRKYTCMLVQLCVGSSLFRKMMVIGPLYNPHPVLTRQANIDALRPGCPEGWVVTS